MKVKDTKFDVNEKAYAYVDDELTEIIIKEIDIQIDEKGQLNKYYFGFKSWWDQNFYEEDKIFKSIEEFKNNIKVKKNEDL